MCVFVDMENVCNLISDEINNFKQKRIEIFLIKEIVEEIQTNKTQINSLGNLQQLESKWQKVITNLELIPDQTTSAKNKNEILNQKRV